MRPCRRLRLKANGRFSLTRITQRGRWTLVWGCLLKEKKENEAALNNFLNYDNMLCWPKEACPIYRQLRATLREKGTPSGQWTSLLLLRPVLVTDNVRGFQRVTDLKIENWLGNRDCP